VFNTHLNSLNPTRRIDSGVQFHIIHLFYHISQLLDLGCVCLGFLDAFAFVKRQKSTRRLSFIPGAFKKAVFS
jgi:hypothetical protein